jgi:hypothetical protein
MSPSLRFREEMSGYVAFGARLPEIGDDLGRADGTQMTLRASVVVPDVDEFIAGPERRAMLRGSLEFEELGGVFSIDRGEMQILPVQTNPRVGRVYYHAGLRTMDGDWLTLRAVKHLKGGRGRSSLIDAMSVRVRLMHDEPDFEQGVDDQALSSEASEADQERTIACGILRARLPALIGDLTSFRARARTRRAGAFAVARFWSAVAGAAADIYLPPALNAGRPSPTEDAPEKPEPPAVPVVAAPAPPPPGADAKPQPAVALQASTSAPPAQSTDASEPAPSPPVTAAPEPGPRPAPVPQPPEPGRGAASTTRVISSVSFPSGLRVSSRDFVNARDQRPLVGVEHVTPVGQADRTKGPVLLVAGSSVAASIFRPPGVNQTIVDRLLDEGYDVWIENWRGSLGHPSREYSLDDAAAEDHPEAVRWVAEQTGAHEIKALVHCLGSSGFMLALASGRLNQDGIRVTHVVSNSVSLHPMVPRRAELKIRALAPGFNRVLPYLDPQWTRDTPLTDAPVPSASAGRDYPPGMVPRSALSRVLVGWSRMTHHECSNDVSNFGQFMYGAGPSTLYDESKLSDVTARWMETQLAWAPARLYRQISRSLIAGHLVPMRRWEPAKLKTDLFETGPARNVDTLITFITGTRNRCFSPTSQWKTYEWFRRHQPQIEHRFQPLEGFGHLDVWLAADQSLVHEYVVEGLER